MAISILATGDLHLGRSSTEVSDREYASTIRTWHNLVDVAVRRKVDALALTGDIVDKDNRFFEAVGPLQTGFDQLGRAGIAVYAVAGNHDWNTLPEILSAGTWPHVHLLGANGDWETKVFEKANERMRFVGRSFVEGIDRTDPLPALRLVPAEPGVPTVGLVHGDVGNPKSDYAPLSMIGFAHKHVDAWLLGHIHKPDTLRAENPLVLYPGSPQAMSPKEQGPHGVVMLVFEGGRVEKTELIPLSSVRYHTLKLDFGETAEADLRPETHMEISKKAKELIGESPGLKALVLDLVISVASNAPEETERKLRELTEGYSPGVGEVECTVRKVRIDVRPALKNLETLKGDPSPAGRLAELIPALENGGDGPRIENLLDAWQKIHDRLSHAPAYRGFVNSKLYDRGEYDASEALLTEAKRLLGALLGQQTKDRG